MEKGRKEKAPGFPRSRQCFVIRAVCPDLLRWVSRAVRLRNECDAASSVSKRAVVDILYGEFVALMWSLPGQTVHNTQALRRPQHDWWDSECYDLMVSRIAACRLWRRERTPAARSAFRAKRVRFHQFWNTRLRAQEQLAGDNPRMAAQNIRQQMGMRRHVLPCTMRSSDSRGGLVEGPACLDAWRAHFRDVPLRPPLCELGVGGPLTPLAAWPCARPRHCLRLRSGECHPSPAARRVWRRSIAPLPTGSPRR